MLRLPIAQPDFHHHADKARDADAAAIADGGGTKAELALGGRHILHDFSKGIDVHGPAEEAFPKDNDEDDVHRRDEVEQGMQGKED